MVKCDICLVYNPNSECLGENCLFVNYGIALKVKNDAVFRAKFEKLNDILSIQSIELLMEIMQTVALATVSAAAASGSGSAAAASGSGSRTNIASGSRPNRTGGCFLFLLD
ncbi:hypothetical protein KY290_010186 [Solanum tuberosum]|uniref:Uncharacterized protein n=1 Tax=Solanum tuberosum TaxID=4113 RepID=A0ABQ7VX73_SOLTU|nr:hypothetical protein KY289_010570 [Solanum tuberosum]KAH0773049.1 hypothetical protein KY290_010186 [Solanum tuberosum]